MLTLNGAIRVIGSRFVLPMRGVWLADLELDADIPASAIPTSGKATLTIGATPGPVANVIGTVDPRGSGAFAGLSKVRMVGGGGGWVQTIRPQDFSNDAGVISTAVYPAIGIQVGEIVTVLAPSVLGTHYHATAGPASRALLREPSWWVDPTTGTTFVGPRPPSVPDLSLTLIHWDPQRQVAELTCDALVLPGTPLVDARLPGPLTIVDLEQTFDGRGSKVTAWCGPPTGAASTATQLAKDLRSMVEELGGLKFVRPHLYRVVLQNVDGRLVLQAVHKASGVPDTLPLDPWTGVSGCSAKLQLGSYVRVSFLEGDPSQPIVDAYQPTAIPLSIDLVASTVINVGGIGATPLTKAAWSAALLAAIEAWASSYSAHPTSPLTGADAVALGTALASALLSIPLATTKALGL